MKRLSSSVFAVVLLMGVSTLLHAQEARITVPLGWYSLPEFAQALSTPERTVVCRADLSQRVALVHLKERSWEEVRALVQEIGLRIEPSGKGRWRLEWLPSVEMRERRWRTQIAQAQDRAVLERMRQILEQVPVLSEKHWDEYAQLSENLMEHLWRLAEQDTESEEFYEAYLKQLELLDLGKWVVPPEIMSWARQIARLPEEIAPYVYFRIQPKDLVEYRVRKLLTSTYQAVEYHLKYALARLWAEPSYRLSFLEAYEQGVTVRVVPLTEVLEMVPEVRFLARASLSRAIAESSTQSVPMEDLYLVYFIRSDYSFYMSGIQVELISSVSDDSLYSSSLPTDPINRSVRSGEWSFGERLREFYQPVWQEARAYVEQAQRATETALEHPALQQPFDAEGLNAANLSRWLYQWAKQTGGEVLMLLYPTHDFVLRVGSKPTLAKLYRENMKSLPYPLGSVSLQMREGVLVCDVLDGCIVRLRDYPLASLKQWYERWDELEYKDYIEYYRSVSPQQNRWWFFGNHYSRGVPFGKALPAQALSLDSYGSLWFGVDLLEHLSPAERSELFEKGELQVDLMSMPEGFRRKLVGFIRNSLGTFVGSGVFHPRWLLAQREYPQLETSDGGLDLGERPLLTIRAERESVGEGKSRLRLRFTPNPKSEISNYFHFEIFEMPYNKWLFD